MSVGTRFEARQEEEENARFAKLQRIATEIGQKDAQRNLTGKGFSGHLMPSEEEKLKEAHKEMRRMIEKSNERAEKYKQYKDKGMKPYKV